MLAYLAQVGRECVYGVPDEYHATRTLQPLHLINSLILAHNPLQARAVLRVGEASSLALREAREFGVLDTLGGNDLGEGVG